MKVKRDDVPVLNKALASEEFSEADKQAIRWQYGLFGSFYGSLFDAIKHADRQNLVKLAKGFPTEVEGFLNWSEGDLNERLTSYARDL